MGLYSKNDGFLLVPVLMNNLPHELKLIISLEFGKNGWKIGPILQVFQNEVEAGDIFYMKLN